jgi:hypothetical protein
MEVAHMPDAICVVGHTNHPAIPTA